MKRLLVVFAVFASLSLFTIGCGGSSSRKASEPTPEEMKQRQEQTQKRLAEIQKGQKGDTPAGAGQR